MPNPQSTETGQRWSGLRTRDYTTAPMSAVPGGRSLRPRAASSTSRQSSPTSTFAMAADWLPLARENSQQVKGGYSRVAQSLKHRDWFMAFVCAIDDRKKDTEKGVQSRMLFKLYAFLRDFLPGGLTGRFAHIKGNQVMEQLLSQTESYVSRHRVTKHAENEFLKLEKWMGGHADWTEALREAKAEVERQKKAGAKKKVSWRAPGMHSPAGMAAVLALSHPDTTKSDSVKFRAWIGQLQIGWMMTQPPSKLAVTEGFWKGITTENLYTVFGLAEPREAETPLLADYDLLFGQQFRTCRKDIKPFLPPWAQDLVLEEDPSDDENREEEAAAEDEGISHEMPEELRPDGANLSSPEGQALRKHLDPPDEVGLADLDIWLAERLASASDRETGGAVLFAWCNNWESRVQKVKDHRHQRITRELFIQSLRRLHSLDLDGPPSAQWMTPYMLSDMADGDYLKELDSYGEGMIMLQALPDYKPFADATAALVSIIEDSSGQASQSLLQRLTKAQAGFFLDLIQGNEFFRHWKSVMSYETCRTRVLLESVGTPDRTGRCVQAEELTDETIAALALTKWQLRLLLLPGQRKILTSTQDELYGSVIHYLTLPDHLSCKPIHVCLRPFEDGILSAKASHLREKHTQIFQLLGDFEEQGKGASGGHSTPLRHGSRAQDPQDRPGPLQQPSVEPLSVPTSAVEGSPQCPIDVESPKAVVSCLTLQKENRSTPPQRHNLSSSRVFRTASPLVPSQASNPYAGRTSRKRRTSSNADDTTTKLAKLDVETLRADMDQLREDVRVELQRHAIQLQASLQDKQAADRDKLWEEIQVRTKADNHQLLSDLVAQTKADRDRLHKELVTDRSEQLLTAVRTLLEDLAALKASVESIRQDLASSIQSAGSISQEMGHKFDGLSKEMGFEIKDLKDTISSLITKMDIANNQSRFLGKSCPNPPEGFNQQDYEKQLERAAWSYIGRLGNPSDGVDPDGRDLEHVASSFPGLRLQDLILALDHIHLQLWHRPFDEGQVEEEL